MGLTSSEIEKSLDERSVRVFRIKHLLQLQVVDLIPVFCLYMQDLILF